MPCGRRAGRLAREEQLAAAGRGVASGRTGIHVQYSRAWWSEGAAGEALLPPLASWLVRGQKAVLDVGTHTELIKARRRRVVG